jgi:hypothetical protein
MKKLILSTAILAALGAGVSTSANAALASNAQLNFNAGVAGGSYGFIVSGSYFGMDTNGDGTIKPPERTGISQFDGLSLGTTQAASGSHGGVPDGSESPGIDAPWNFFKNTGMQYSATPTNVLSASGNTATIDFSGWGVTWNGIPAINMGGGIQDCGTAADGVCINPADGSDISGVFNNGTGIATVTCAVDCAVGDTYVLNYDAVVPQADPSNFGGVSFTLHLEGTVAAGAVSAVPVPAAAWLFGSGLLGLVGVARRKSRA